MTTSKELLDTPCITIDENEEAQRDQMCEFSNQFTTNKSDEVRLKVLGAPEGKEDNKFNKKAARTVAALDKKCHKLVLNSFLFKSIQEKKKKICYLRSKLLNTSIVRN